jgi:hypoxanthine phosphoribosyltransferase
MNASHQKTNRASPLPNPLPEGEGVLISWSEVQRLCQRLAGLIRESGFRPDLIVAIGRGGYVPARLLCDYLDIMGLTSIKVEHYLAGASKQEETIIRYPLKADIKGLRVLLVDDVNDTGDTLLVATRHLQTFRPADVRTAVVHEKTVSRIAADYFAMRIVRWRWLIHGGYCNRISCSCPAFFAA